ncbi:MAG: metallophosphoesterase [Chlamydiales bacterium]|nr:metallophosphoesterase [Chlamydiales bacterium]
MKIFAIADLHLAISTPDKTMEAFGAAWKDYHYLIQQHWKDIVSDEDLVLLPGDISWAMKFEDALLDLCWIDKLPGKKIILKGNHDYWWPSNAKLSAKLPPSISFINNNALQINEVAIGGARLWDDPAFSFDKIIDFVPSNLVKNKHEDTQREEALFEKELLRLESSLKQINESSSLKICMTHFPPLPHTLQESKASTIIDKYHMDICIFGHLHNVKQGTPLFGKYHQTTYIFVAADYLQFKPKLIATC